MRILALDSSGAACSAAYWADGAIRGRRLERLERGHAERLVPMVQAAVADSGASLDEVDLFAATVGPGGFTGVRIGLATLRALALAARRPMLGVTSFEALAHGTSVEERAGRRLLVLIESRRSGLYAQTFTDALAPESEAVALPPNEIAARFAAGPLLLAGDGVERLMPTLAGRDGVPRVASNASFVDAAVVASLAAERAAAASSEPPAPLYLRGPDISMPNIEAR